MLKCLRDMHPNEADIRKLPIPEAHLLHFSNCDDAKENRMDVIRTCIKSFKTTSAAGPSGLKAAHLKDLLCVRQTAL